MIQINNFEKTVRAFIEKDPRKAIKIIDEEISIAKKRGYHNVVSRLKTLAAAIPNETTYSGASFAPPKAGTKVVNLSLGNDSLYIKLHPKFTLNEVVLPEASKGIVSSFLDEWGHHQELAEFNMEPANKLLLYGPPGTGKTKLAHAIAYELDLPLVLVRLDELISSYLGKTGKNIRQIFELAESESVVLLLDEIDTIAKNRTDAQDLGELKRVVTVFLQNIDLLSPHSIVIGATNHEELLDKAIWRRFPHKIAFTLPDVDERRKLVKLFMGERAKDIPVTQIAEIAEGLSGSSIKDYCETLIKYSVIQEKPVDRMAALHTLISMLGKEGAVDKQKRKRIYKVAQLLHKEGYTVKEIESISGIAYTTLREHLN